MNVLLSRLDEKALIFARTRAVAEEMSDYLEDAGIPATSLHGDLNQSRRTRNLQLLTSGRVNVLVATDVAARGIHVDDISLVIQADAPEEYKTYLHRSGRTGRAGKVGATAEVATGAGAGTGCLGSRGGCRAGIGCQRGVGAAGSNVSTAAAEAIPRPAVAVSVSSPAVVGTPSSRATAQPRDGVGTIRLSTGSPSRDAVTASSSGVSTQAFPHRSSSRRTTGGDADPAAHRRGVISSRCAGGPGTMSSRTSPGTAPNLEVPSGST